MGGVNIKYNHGGENDFLSKAQRVIKFNRKHRPHSNKTFPFTKKKKL